VGISLQTLHFVQYQTEPPNNRSISPVRLFLSSCSAFSYTNPSSSPSVVHIFYHWPHFVPLSSNLQRNLYVASRSQFAISCQPYYSSFHLQIITLRHHQSAHKITYIQGNNLFWCRIHLWFRLMGGLQAKSMTSQRYRAVTRWRICVTMATLWQQQYGGYALLWQRYENNNMAAMRYYSTSSTVQS